tara:strand:+ start:4787 stop:5044 length:258 start_codon:yes stop_codon:yes gene_type:complete
MKTTTKELILEELEETIEKKGLHIQGMISTSKRLAEIKAEKLTKDKKEMCIEETVLCQEMDKLKLDFLDTKIETLKAILLRDSIK